MILLHGSWMTASPGAEPAFVLWAATSETRSNARGRQHPFSAGAHELRRALCDLAPAGEDRTRQIEESTVTLLLPSAPDVPDPSPGMLRAENPSRQKRVLAAWQADALDVLPRDSLALLASLPSENEMPPGIRLETDLRYWQVAARLALELLARQRVKP
ncbi:MAG: hypothetical protein M1482_07035, partial [Chloroflexi bacterium]|nr:hypothetical protein [Chloroflexota bacterium]